MISADGHFGDRLRPRLPVLGSLARFGCTDGSGDRSCLRLLRAKHSPHADWGAYTLSEGVGRMAEQSRDFIMPCLRIPTRRS
jgi:hypothetical protein